MCIKLIFMHILWTRFESEVQGNSDKNQSTLTNNPKTACRYIAREFGSLVVMNHADTDYMVKL